MCPSRSSDQFLIISLTDSVMASRNDVTDGMEVNEGLFWRPARLQCILGGQPLGLGRIVVNFFKRKDLFYFYFYWWILTVLIEIYPKTTFSRFYRFFWACTKILDFFSDKSSLLGNRFIPFKRSTQFLPIPMVFGYLKNPYWSQ